MKKRLTGVLALVVVVALAALVAGCGGGDDKKGYALSKSEYVAALNGICKEVNARVDEIGKGVTDLKQGLKDKGDELLAEYDGAIDRVEALNPPDELKDAHDRFVDTINKLRGLTDDAVKAAKDDDDETFTSKTNELDEVDAESDKIATDELGATECAKN